MLALIVGNSDFIALGLDLLTESLFAACLLVHFAALMMLARLVWAELPPETTRVTQSLSIPESGVGVYIHAVGEARPRLAHNELSTLNPASTIKLLTIANGLPLTRSYSIDGPPLR